ncbi:hypothetical protein PENNAL_c0365G05037, partial [Penicillium nalgiovense]
INKALNQSQERSLIRWIELLNSVYTPPIALDIEGAANRILQRCGSGRQPMEKARIEAELHGELVHWYKVFGQFLRKYKIQAHELYNWDETGFQLGVGTKENVASTRENETIATGGIG